MICAWKPIGMWGAVILMISRAWWCSLFEIFWWIPSCGLKTPGRSKVWEKRVVWREQGNLVLFFRWKIEQLQFCGVMRKSLMIYKRFNCSLGDFERARRQSHSGWRVSQPFLCVSYVIITHGWAPLWFCREYIRKMVSVGESDTQQGVLLEVYSFSIDLFFLHKGKIDVALIVNQELRSGNISNVRIFEMHSVYAMAWRSLSGCLRSLWHPWGHSELYFTAGCRRGFVLSYLS